MRKLSAQDIESALKENDEEITIDLGFEDSSAGAMDIDEDSLPEEDLEEAKETLDDMSFSGYRNPIQSEYLVTGAFSPGSATDARHKGGHDGVDLMAQRGTPVFPIASGIVTSVGSNPAGGNTVNTSHEDGRVTAYYAHMDGIAVTKGEAVSYNTVIGHVSDTGNAKGTCPHLHLQIWEDGRLINPASKFSIAPYNHEAVMFAGKNGCQIKSASNKKLSLFAQIKFDEFEKDLDSSINEEEESIEEEDSLNKDDEDNIDEMLEEEKVYSDPAEAARDFVATNPNLKAGHCWDWVHKVYEAAGFAPRPIYQDLNYVGKEAGTHRANESLLNGLQPGDWLYINNKNQYDTHGNHSVIFLGWKGDHVAEVASYFSNSSHVHTYNVNDYPVTHISKPTKKQIKSASFIFEKFSSAINLIKNK